MEREALVAEIVAREWEMFQSVANVGGPADCQHDPETFKIMRLSQMETWDQALLESYREDLVAAQLAGRNLLSEKYAWMMRETHPQEFAALQAQLPVVSASAKVMIEEIVAVHLTWQREVALAYPTLLSHGRAATGAEKGTSLETYLRGELSTYSEKTLELYRALVLAKQQAGQNEAKENLWHQVRQYGFASLEDCEAYLRNRAKEE